MSAAASQLQAIIAKNYSHVAEIRKEINQIIDNEAVASIRDKLLEISKLRRANTMNNELAKLLSTLLKIDSSDEETAEMSSSEEPSIAVDDDDDAEIAKLRAQIEELKRKKNESKDEAVDADDVIDEFFDIEDPSDIADFIDYENDEIKAMKVRSEDMLYKAISFADGLGTNVVGYRDFKKVSMVRTRSEFEILQQKTTTMEVGRFGSLSTEEILGYNTSKANAFIVRSNDGELTGTAAIVNLSDFMFGDWDTHAIGVTVSYYNDKRGERIRETKINEALKKEVYEDFINKLPPKADNRGVVECNSSNYGVHFTTLRNKDFDKLWIDAFGYSNHQMFKLRDGTDIELFAGFDKTKFGAIVLPETKVKRENGEIVEYKFLNDSAWDTVIAIDIVDYLKALGYYDDVIKTMKQAKKSRFSRRDFEYEEGKVDNKEIKALIDGADACFDKALEAIEDQLYMHANDKTKSAGGLNAYLFAQSLKCISIDLAKKWAKASLFSNKGFDKYKETLESDKEVKVWYWRVLAKAIHNINPNVWSKFIEPFVMKMKRVSNFSSEKNIDLKDTKFFYSSIQLKCQRRQYKTLRELAFDLTRVFACIENTNDFVEKKQDEAIPHLCEMKHIPASEFETRLKRLICRVLKRVQKKNVDEDDDDYEETQKTSVNGYQAFIGFQVQFNVKADNAMFDWFNGYYYDPNHTSLEEAYKHPGVIAMIQHMKEIVYNNEELSFKFWWENEKKKYRTHGRKLHMSLFQSELKGSGKTFIHDVLYTLYRKYVRAYRTLGEALDSKHAKRLKGILYILVEEMPSYDDRNWSNEILKNAITGTQSFEGRGMYSEYESIKPTYDFSGTTNFRKPVYIDSKNERRHFITEVDPKYANGNEGHDEYFNNLWKYIKPDINAEYCLDDFAYALSAILYYEPMDESVDLYNIPMTAKKEKMIIENQKEKEEDKYIEFIIENRDLLMLGQTGSWMLNRIRDFLNLRQYKERIGNQAFLTKLKNSYLASRRVNAKEELIERGVSKGTWVYELTAEQDAKYLSNIIEDENETNDCERSCLQAFVSECSANAQIENAEDGEDLKAQLMLKARIAQLEAFIKSQGLDLPQAE